MAELHADAGVGSLFERHRPRSWDDVVGQPKAVAMLKRTGAGGKAFLFAGPSGTGKTTMARLLAEQLAEPWHVDEIDAQDCTMDYLRGIEAEMAYKGMGSKLGKAWIVNECHALRGPVLTRFLTLLERIPSHCVVIFTTTRRPQTTLFADHDDADPFVSRCLKVPLAWHEYAPNVAGPMTRVFAVKALEIARTEGLDGRPLAEYERLALECKHNFRMMLSRIEAGEMLS